MSDTPRTDAKRDELNAADCTSAEYLTGFMDFARQLERELQEANNKLAKLSRLIDLAEKANDAQTEIEVACSATFAEALAYQNAELLKQERDHWKQRAEAAEQDTKRLDWLENLDGQIQVNPEWANKATVDIVKGMLLLESFNGVTVRQAIDVAMKGEQT